MYVVGKFKEGCSRILSPRLAAGLTSMTVAVRSIWVTRRLDCSAFVELPLILRNELYLGPPPHILPTIQKPLSYLLIQPSFIKLWIYNSFTNMYIRLQFSQIFTVYSFDELCIPKRTLACTNKKKLN